MSEKNKREGSSLDLRKWVVFREEVCRIMCWHDTGIATQSLLSRLGVVTKEPLGALALVKVCVAIVYVNLL